MEFAATRRSKKWKRKRRSKKRLRDQIRVEVEVRSASKHRRAFPKTTDAFGVRETTTGGTMQADAFWKNYTVAQEWQRRHNITWWKSRCVALEYENEVLRNKIKSLVHHSSYPDVGLTRENKYHNENNEDEEDTQEETHLDLDEKNVEFNVTEDMLSIIEQSERHRRELKHNHKSRETACEEEVTEGISIVGGAEEARARKQEANLLYGDASSKLLAMETALQATVDNYRDKVKPQYWPNIPLKP